MAANDVEETLQIALDRVHVTQVKVKHRPRLLSDNGPAFVSNTLKDYLRQYRLHHIRGAPYHPMTQGKIERYHRSMKNVVKLQTFYFPWELEKAIEYYSLAVQIKPDWSLGHQKLGYAYLNNTDYKAAIASFKKFLELAPDDEAAETIRNLIPQLEKMIK